MRVMAYGTFDNFHPGHFFYLEKAGNYGDELIVVVARDENVLKIKGHLPQEEENIRRQKVEEAIRDLGFKGKAILGHLKDRWQVVKEYRPDIICLGYDQPVNLETLKEVIESERFFCEIKRLDSYFPDKYKSSFCRL